MATSTRAHRRTAAATMHCGMALCAAVAQPCRMLKSKGLAYECHTCTSRNVWAQMCSSFKNVDPFAKEPFGQRGMKASSPVLWLVTTIVPSAASTALG